MRSILTNSDPVHGGFYMKQNVSDCVYWLRGYDPKFVRIFDSLRWGWAKPDPPHGGYTIKKCKPFTVNS